MISESGILDDAKDCEKAVGKGAETDHVSREKESDEPFDAKYDAIDNNDNISPDISEDQDDKTIQSTLSCDMETSEERINSSDSFEDVLQHEVNISSDEGTDFEDLHVEEEQVSASDEITNINEVINYSSDEIKQEDGLCHREDFSPLTTDSSSMTSSDFCTDRLSDEETIERLEKSVEKLQRLLNEMETFKIRLYDDIKMTSNTLTDKSGALAKLEHKSTAFDIVIRTNVKANGQEDEEKIRNMTILPFNLNWNFVRITKKNKYFFEMVSCSVQLCTFSSSKPQLLKVRQHHVKEIFFQVFSGIWAQEQMFFYEYTVCVQVDGPIYSCLASRQNPDLPYTFIQLNTVQTPLPVIDAVVGSNNHVVQIQTTQHQHSTDLLQGSRMDTCISSQQAAQYNDTIHTDPARHHARCTEIRNRQGQTKKCIADIQNERENCFVTQQGQSNSIGSNYQRDCNRRMSSSVTQKTSSVYGQEVHVTSNDIETKPLGVDTGRNFSHIERHKRDVAKKSKKASNVNQIESKQREGNCASHQPIFPPTVSLNDCSTRFLQNGVDKKKPVCQTPVTTASLDNYQGHGDQNQDEINMTTTIFQDGVPSDQFQTTVQEGSTMIPGIRKKGQNNSRSKVSGTKMPNGAESPNTCVNRENPSDLHGQEGKSCATKRQETAGKLHNINAGTPNCKRLEGSQIIHKIRPYDISSKIINQEVPSNLNLHEERNDSQQWERGAIESFLISPVGRRVLRAGYRRADVARAVHGLLQDVDIAELKVDIVLAALISLSSRQHRPPELPFDYLLDDNAEDVTETETIDYRTEDDKGGDCLDGRP